MAVNGCGPNDWRKRFIKDRPQGFDFRAACDRHDECYATPLADKAVCDGRFYRDMQNYCRNLRLTRAQRLAGTRAACLRWASTYFLAVVRFGDAAFKRAQSQAVLCLGRRATIVGTDGDDVLRGTPGNDVIVARGGRDDIAGQDGDDVLCGDDGDDRLDGGAGSDALESGLGVDVCFAGEEGESCSAPPSFTPEGAVSPEQRREVEEDLARAVRFLRARASVAVDGFSVSLRAGGNDQGITAFASAGSIG